MAGNAGRSAPTKETPLDLVGDFAELPETDDLTKLWQMQRIIDDGDRFQAMLKTFQKALEPTMEIHKWAR
ncbi:hypothetical protein BH20ACT21_BH20ACT21_07510 [soil metagenome]